ncbi:MAG: hypothetical protein EOO09_12280 [Chitinophagaceae bacterium]|nr:MAG: hypothetical protein EOO09_12280 [Chitinophagaceae bacterium]
MKEWTEGIHYYYNSEGLIVLTAAFHLSRGHCCGNGCIHCPFDYINVPEPKRTQLRTDASKKITGEKKNDC